MKYFSVLLKVGFHKDVLLGQEDLRFAQQALETFLGLSGRLRRDKNNTTHIRQSL